MKLPNAERAVIPIEKLRDYSLNPNHPKGKHKARVFLEKLQLKADDAERLHKLITEAIFSEEATEIIRNDEDFPRLTSCYIPRRSF